MTDQDELFPLFERGGGLLPAIAQDAVTGEVLMLAWMNTASLEQTLVSRRATYYSRSRQQLWTKGETSGNWQEIVSIHVDCDRDAILLRVQPHGPSCHTGARSCFFRELQGEPPMTAEDRFAQLQIVLPPAPKPIGLYRPLTVCGALAFLAGHGPLQPDGSLIKGRVGVDLDVAQGAAAARQTGLALLATLRAQLGSLDRVVRLVKLLGMVQCNPEFTEQPAVINGCSQLLADVFGAEHGVAARSAVGVAALPAGMAVEIEAIFEIKP